MDTTRYHFVSLVGEGASSALVPFLGHLALLGPPLSVTLLPSSLTARWVPGLAAEIRSRAPSAPLRVIQVASGLEGQDRGLPRVRDELGRLEKESDEPLAVNVMGGMRLSVMGALASLKGINHVFLQTTDDRLVLSRLTGGLRSESLVMGPSLPAKRLLELQLADHRPDPEPRRDLGRLCREAGLNLPADALCQMVVGGRRVDCLWSAGNNVLQLLLIASKRSRDPSKALAGARRVEVLAGSKDWIGGLMSKKIHVLETEARNVERFSAEMGPLVRARRVDWSDERLTPAARDALTDIFGPRPPKEPAAPREAITDSSPEPALITSLGRLSDATMLAVAAHGRRQLVLLHTPEDEWVAGMLKIYQAKAAALGLTRIVSLPTDFTAADVQERLPEGLARHAEVNVTPGTRAQGAALALWAKARGVPIWALFRDRIRRLDHPAEPRPVPPLPLRTRLDLTLEAPINDYGWDRRARDWEDPFYERMLALMRLSIESGRPGAFLRDDLELGGFGLTLADRDQNHWRLSWPGDDLGPAGSKVLKDGFWYERLTAKAVHALNRLGPVLYDVACGVEVSPPGRPGRLLTERDVLAADSRSRLYMISCKTAGRFKGSDRSRVLSEVLAMARTLGRFVIPILCDMTTSEPKMAGEVLIMGWTTLCRPERLRKALETAARSVHG